MGCIKEKCYATEVYNSIERAAADIGDHPDI
jgi:hypothetical protein